MVRIAVIIAAVALSGCVSFVPTYDNALYTDLSAVQTDVGKIHTTVQTVHDGPTTPFSSVESYYTDAFTHLNDAMKIAKGQVSYLRGKMAEKPAQDLQKSIANCQQALTLTMNAFKMGPISPAVESTFADNTACAAPSTMEALLKGNP